MLVLKKIQDNIKKIKNIRIQFLLALFCFCISVGSYVYVKVSKHVNVCE